MKQKQQIKTELQEERKHHIHDAKIPKLLGIKIGRK